MDLEALISQVEEAAVTEEPLDQVSAAMGLKADVDELTDSLIDVFVDRARKAGCSWSEIGSAMGVTKQAAQQRHRSERPRKTRGGHLFTRFTERARGAVREAERAAQSLDHSYIGTEHLLLGVLSQPESVGARAVVSLGLTREQVVAAAEAVDAVGAPRRRRHTPFTPRAKKVLELSLREALAMGHSYIGTEHIVLGLLREKDGVASKVMTEQGITRDALLSEITTLLVDVSPV